LRSSSSEESLSRYTLHWHSLYLIFIGGGIVASPLDPWSTTPTLSAFVEGILWRSMVGVASEKQQFE